MIILYHIEQNMLLLLSISLYQKVIDRKVNYKLKKWKGKVLYKVILGMFLLFIKHQTLKKFIIFKENSQCSSSSNHEDNTILYTKEETKALEMNNL